MIRNKSKYIDLATQKSGSIFTTATLKELSEQYFDLTARYEKQQHHLVKEVVQVAGESEISVHTNVSDVCSYSRAPRQRVGGVGCDCQVGQLTDITHSSFAHVSANAPISYVKPQLSEKGSGNVNVVGARHPCLEVQDEISFIANDHVMVKGMAMTVWD